MTERGTTAIDCGIRSMDVSVFVAEIPVSARYPLTGPAVVISAGRPPFKSTPSGSLSSAVVGTGDVGTRTRRALFAGRLAVTDRLGGIESLVEGVEGRAGALIRTSGNVMSSG